MYHVMVNIPLVVSLAGANSKAIMGLAYERIQDIVCDEIK